MHLCIYAFMHCIAFMHLSSHEIARSEKTDSIRTIRGFSTSALEKLSGEKWFDIYQGYWREPDYADLFTTAACNGTDAFDGVDTVVRAEGCVKGAQ